jgi:YVTN family beta-propeller protein
LEERMTNHRRFGRTTTGAALSLLAVAAFLGIRNAAPSDADVGPPTSGTLVLANLRQESLTFIDFARGAAETRVLQLPGPPHEMVEVEGRLYLTLGRANLLAEVDPSGPAILRTLSLPGEPHGIAAQGTDLLVTLDAANEVVRIDRAALAVTARYATPDTPHAIAVGADAIFVTATGEDTVARLGPAPGSVTVGAAPESLELAGDIVVTADSASGTVTLIDRSTLAVRAQVDAGPRPSRVVALPSGDLAVALNGASSVAIIEPASARVTRLLDSGPGPDGLCVSASHDWLAVTSAAEGTITLFAFPSLEAAVDLAFPPGAGACLWLKTSQ